MTFTGESPNLKSIVQLLYVQFLQTLCIARKLGLVAFLEMMKMCIVVIKRDVRFTGA